MIELTELNPIWEKPYLDKQYKDEDFTTVGELNLNVSFNGKRVPNHYKVLLIEEDFYILNIKPKLGWDDGFNIYKIDRLLGNK